MTNLKNTNICTDFKDNKGNWVKSYRAAPITYRTKSGQVWRDINTRCLVGGAYQIRRPTYLGCTMSEMFKNFQLFTDWHTRQVGYGVKGYQIDKDILYNGNKIYSESCCVIIPSQLNMFLTSHISARGLYPQGVHFDRLSGLFRAQISSALKPRLVGSFLTVDSAAAAYKSAKESEAYCWYERLRDGEFIVDERVIERMRTWTLSV